MMIGCFIISLLLLARRRDRLLTPPAEFPAEIEQRIPLLTGECRNSDPRTPR
jgi:hypothetical protein